MYIYNINDIAKFMRQYWSMDDGYSLRKDLKKPDYIWSEDETVRRNRELTEEYNKTILNNIEKIKALKSEHGKNLYEQIYEYIIEAASYNGVKLSKNHAIKIWSYCTIHHEDEPWAYLHEIIDLACDIIREVFDNE